MDTTKKMRIVCSSENETPGWRWLEGALSKDNVEFEIHDCSALSKLESIIKKPYLARYRVAWNAARRSRLTNADLLISFGPALAAFTGHAAQFHRSPAYHMIFAFNYTNLPGGSRRSIARSAFQKVDKFVVPSSIERTLYSEYFSLNPDRFDVQLWGIDKPHVPENATRIIEGDYVCAIGGEGRDYDTLFAAARLTPHVRYVVVTRPYTIPNQQVPENVTMFVNLSAEKCWTIVQQSRALLVPLRDSTVPCGHVTMVAGMHMRKALIVTDSAGVADYVRHEDNALLVAPKAADMLARSVERLLDEPALAEKLGANGERFAKESCSEASTVRYFRTVLEQLQITK